MSPDLDTGADLQGERRAVLRKVRRRFAEAEAAWTAQRMAERTRDDALKETEWLRQEVSHLRRKVADLEDEMS